jgi:uncharacterized membrane protein
MKKPEFHLSQFAVLTIILLSFAAGIAIYPHMPEMMASHWDAAGNVNGYMSRFWGVFLMPFISIAVLVLLMVLPRIDPMRENIEKFRKYFDWFIVLISAFLFYIYLITLLWNSGYELDMTRYMVPAMAVLFFYVGVLVSNAKRNWTIGIRTPWTMSSEIVWEKTHKLGGALLKASAAVSLLGLLSHDYAFWFTIVPIIGVSIYLFFYSYLLYKKTPH